MNPILKKIVTAVAVKEGLEKIREYKQPKRSFARRNGGKLTLLALGTAAGAYYALKVARKPGAAASEGGYRDEFPTGPAGPTVDLTKESEPVGTA